MKTWSRRKHRYRSDRGASAVEYGLMVAAIAAVVVAAVFMFGNVVQNSFSKSDTCFQNATGTTSTFGSCPTNP